MSQVRKKNGERKWKEELHFGQGRANLGRAFDPEEEVRFNPST